MHPVHYMALGANTCRGPDGRCVWSHSGRHRIGLGGSSGRFEAILVPSFGCMPRSPMRDRALANLEAADFLGPGITQSSMTRDGFIYFGYAEKKIAAYCVSHATALCYRAPCVVFFFFSFFFLSMAANAEIFSRQLLSLFGFSFL